MIGEDKKIKFGNIFKTTSSRVATKKLFSIRHRRKSISFILLIICLSAGFTTHLVGGTPMTNTQTQMKPNAYEITKFKEIYQYEINMIDIYKDAIEKRQFQNQDHLKMLKKFLDDQVKHLQRLNQYFQKNEEAVPTQDRDFKGTLALAWEKFRGTLSTDDSGALRAIATDEKPLLERYEALSKDIKISEDAMKIVTDHLKDEIFHEEYLKREGGEKK